MAAYVRLSGTPHYIGAASDTKPASCPSGSRCYEHDTQKWYVTYNGGTNWVEINQQAKDISIYLVGANLTTDGVAYSDEKVTTTLNTAIDVYEYTFEPETIGGTILWVYFNIVATLKAKNASADVKMKMLVRDKDGTWQDLFSEVTYANINTVYLDKRYEGYLVKGAEAYCTPTDADLWTYFTKVPFDFKVTIEADEADGGFGKIKNSSLIRVVYI